MNPPRRDWGKAFVNIPYSSVNAWANGIVLPRDYELDQEYGMFYNNPNMMGHSIVVTGPDIPITEEGTEYPRLMVDSGTWDRIVVYPYEHKK